MMSVLGASSAYSQTERWLLGPGSATGKDSKIEADCIKAEDGIRDSSTSRGLGDVYKRQLDQVIAQPCRRRPSQQFGAQGNNQLDDGCLLDTSPSPRDVEESRMPSSA